MAREAIEVAVVMMVIILIAIRKRGRFIHTRVERIVQTGGGVRFRRLVIGFVVRG